MKVSQIMTTDVQVAYEKTTFNKLARMIVCGQYAGVPVVDEDHRLIGIVSEKDLLYVLYPTYQELFEFEYPTQEIDLESIEHRAHEQGVKKLTAKDLMKTDVIVSQPAMPIMQAGALMLANRVRRLPVVDKEHRLVGIISQGDVTRAILTKELAIKCSPKTQRNHH